MILGNCSRYFSPIAEIPDRRPNALCLLPLCRATRALPPSPTHGAQEGEESCEESEAHRWEEEDYSGPRLG